MKWYGYMCISDVPLGVPSPPFDDPRHLSRKISEEVVDYGTIPSYSEEPQILKEAIEKWLTSLTGKTLKER
jgi:hypothetical protein